MGEKETAPFRGLPFLSIIKAHRWLLSRRALVVFLRATDIENKAVSERKRGAAPDRLLLSTA